MVSEPSGWLCVADPDWLDYLARQPDLRSLVYYKGPYRPLTKLPRDAPFICCRRGETPRRICLIGTFNGYEVLRKGEAWNRYHRRLGVPDVDRWRAVDVGADDRISYHEIVNFRFLDNPVLLEETGVTLTNPASSMGRYLSRVEAQQILAFVGSADSVAVGFAEEVHNPFELFEGAYTQILVNSYERNPEARRLCVEHHGSSCAVCGLSFASMYGEIGTGFIHVHHLVPLASIGAEYQINPVLDLRPVCPNCHAMIHKRVPPYSVEELRELIANCNRVPR